MKKKEKNLFKYVHTLLLDPASWTAERRSITHKGTEIKLYLYAGSEIMMEEPVEIRFNWWQRRKLMPLFKEIQLDTALKALTSMKLGGGE